MKLPKLSDGLPPSISTLVRTCWPLGIIATVLSVWSSMEQFILAPYLYSRVQCCGRHGDLDSKFDITDPTMVSDIQGEAALHGFSVPLVNDRIPACAVPELPSESKLWSQSPGCVNGPFVRDSAQRVLAISSPLQSAAQLLVLPVGGAISDACGRRGVLMTYILCCLVSSIILMLDAKLYDSWGDAMMLIALVLMCPALDPKTAVLSASVSDLVGERVSANGSALALLFACTYFGVLVGGTAMFFVLGLHLSSYFVPWLVFSCIAFACAVFALFISETLPKSMQTGLKLHMFNPLWSQYQAISLMLTDNALIILMVLNMIYWIQFQGTMSVLFSYLMSIGFAQNTAVLPILASNCATIVTSFALSRYRNNRNVMKYIFAGAVLNIPACALSGPIATAIGHLGVYLGFCLIGVCMSLMQPSFQAIVSCYAGEENQGKCQSALATSAKIGGVIGPIVWNRWFFDSTDTGIVAAKPYFAAMAVMVFCAAIAGGLLVLDGFRQKTLHSPLADDSRSSSREEYGSTTKARTEP